MSTGEDNIGMSADEVMNEDGISVYLKTSKRTLQKLMRERDIPYLKLEKRVLFRKVDVDRWLETKIIK